MPSTKRKSSTQEINEEILKTPKKQQKQLKNPLNDSNDTNPVAIESNTPNTKEIQRQNALLWAKQQAALKPVKTISTRSRKPKSLDSDANIPSIDEDIKTIEDISMITQTVATEISKKTKKPSRKSQATQAAVMNSSLNTIRSFNALNPLFYRCY